MTEKKYRKYYVDWWNIKRSTVYGGVSILLLLGLLIGGGWWLYRNDFFLAKTETNDIPQDAARIISFEGDVRITRVTTRETIVVTKPTYVAAGDTVQTQSDGRAQIQMIDGSVLSIRPNSTVVIRDSSTLFGGKNVRVALDDGQINVKTEDQSTDTENVVEVRDSENKIQSQTDASFGINPNNNGGEIRVSRGGVETSVGDEKTVVQSGEFAAVNNGKIASKENLLQSPKIIAPTSQDSVQALSNGNADVTFRWQKPNAPVQSFHLQISRSPFFLADTLVFERTSLTETSFTVANLAPGTFYWQVRATANSGQISEWSEKVRFTIVKGAANQGIAITDWNVEKLGGKIYRIGGKTQAGAVVRAGGREAFAASDGSFLIQIAAQTDQTSVEVSDERGNRSGFVISLSSGKVLRQY
ncbi:hypothetical protein BH10ACI1_BH10ACI1_00810 [soil metagenome]